MSLRAKLVLLVLGLNTVLLAGLGWVVDVALDRWTSEVVDGELTRRVDVLVEEAHLEGDGRLELDDDDDLAARGLPFRIEDQHGTHLAGSANWPTEALTALGAATVAAKAGGAPVRVLSVAFIPRHGSEPLVLRVAAPLGSVSLVAERFRHGLLLALLLTAMLSVAGAALLAHWFVAPIRGLARAANALEASSLSGRLEAAGLDPALRQLAVAFNGLLGRVEGALATQRSLVARASHALRTPLASVLTQAEVALNRERDGERYRSALRSIAETTQDASRLVDGLLAQARADAPGRSGERGSLELRELAEALRRSFSPRAEGQGLRFTCEVPEGLRVYADSSRVRESLEAVLDNAFRYTPRGGVVSLSAHQEGAFTVLEVLDDGPGISADERELVFSRFYRGAAARTSGQPGSGLGLSLVKTLVEADGGSTRILEAPGGGTRVVIAIPSAP